jgi:hypothetical protein
MSYTYLKRTNEFKYEGRDIAVMECGLEKIKATLKDLKSITEILGVGGSGSKEILCMRILKHIAKELNIQATGTRQEVLERILTSLQAQRVVKTPTAAPSFRKGQQGEASVSKTPSVSIPETSGTVSPKKKKPEFEQNNMIVSWNNKTNDFSICDKKQLRKNNILLKDLKDLISLMNIPSKTSKLKVIEDYCNAIRTFLIQTMKKSTTQKSVVVPVPSASPIPSTTPPPPLLSTQEMIPALLPPPPPPRAQGYMTRQEIRQAIQQCLNK